jgi:hypothetical protein
MSTWGGGVWAGGGTAGAGPLPNIYVGTGLLYPALRKANVTLGPQRIPSPAQYQDALDELNRLIGSLNCDRFFIYTRNRIEAPLLESNKTYTIGPSPDPDVPSDIDAPRPQWIEAANIISALNLPALRYPLTIVSDLQWAEIGMQDMPDTIPEILYNDRAYPVSTLYLWGQPVAGSVLELFCWQPIPLFASPDDAVWLPPGYEDALVLNLAVRLAPHFQKMIDPGVREDARLSLMRLMSINAPQPIADLSGGLGCDCRGFNIYRG